MFTQNNTVNAAIDNFLANGGVIKTCPTSKAENTRYLHIKKAGYAAKQRCFK